MVFGPDDEDLLRRKKRFGSTDGFLDERVSACEGTKLFGPVCSVALSDIGLQALSFSTR